MLLTCSNPKTQKGVKKGYVTAIQHFAPSRLSGFNVCEFATGECIRFCLNKAGRGGIFKKGETTNAIQQARIKRTRLWLDNPNLYKSTLIKEIEAFKKRAAKLNLTPCIRLNGTSDIRWEEHFAPLFWRFEDIQFYDYTKDHTRMMRFLSGRWAAKNYHLTFSRSELNDAQCDEVLAHGGNVAIVFDSVPDTYRGVTVLDGDADDLRFLDDPGYYIGLKAKGKLGRSDSPFKVLTRD